MDTVEVNGLRLAYRRAGHGRSVMFVHGGAEYSRTALTAMAEADLTSVLPTIAVPTQLIWGALDVRSPLAVAHDFKRRIPGAILTVIPDCGHVSNLEAPRAFNDVVRGFLDDIC